MSARAFGILAEDLNGLRRGARSRERIAGKTVGVKTWASKGCARLRIKAGPQMSESRARATGR